MTNAVSVSIGIPFFNCPRDAGGRVRSVFAQTYGDWELLLVDDGSTDGSLEIAQRDERPAGAVVSDGVQPGTARPPQPDCLPGGAGIWRGWTRTI